MTCRRCPTCGRQATNESRIYQAVRKAERAGISMVNLRAETGLSEDAVTAAARELRQDDLIVRPSRFGRFYAAGMEPQA